MEAFDIVEQNRKLKRQNATAVDRCAAKQRQIVWLEQQAETDREIITDLRTRLVEQEREIERLRAVARPWGPVVIEGLLRHLHAARQERDTLREQLKQQGPSQLAKAIAGLVAAALEVAESEGEDERG